MHFSMITVAAEYQQIAGLRKNTVRRWTEKYSGMMPGHTVTMRYVPALDEPAFASERLRVRSIGLHESLADAVYAHWQDNHAGVSPRALMGILARLYDVKPRDPVRFAAIYFD